MGCKSKALLSELQALALEFEKDTHSHFDFTIAFFKSHVVEAAALLQEHAISKRTLQGDKRLHNASVVVSESSALTNNLVASS